jgi:hypothetical protein
MDEATKVAKRTIAVLSAGYLNALYTQAEWAEAFRQDPEGKQGTLLSVLVEKCKLEGLLAAIVYINLTDLDEPAAREKLLEGIRRERAIPKQAPHFPSSASRKIVG